MGSNSSANGTRNGIDLVLMDIMMPEMDGYTAMREIREAPRVKKRLPIIAHTAKAMRDDQEKCLAAGANDYIAKPLDIEKLLSLVLRVCGCRKYPCHVGAGSAGHARFRDRVAAAASTRSDLKYHYDFPAPTAGASMKASPYPRGDGALLAAPRLSQLQDRVLHEPAAVPSPCSTSSRCR